MAKILVSLYNNFIKQTDKIDVLPPFYEGFLKGLKELGNEVLCFVYKDWGKDFSTDIPNEIEKKIRSFNPDLCIFFNNNFWDVSKIFDCPILVYDVDSPNMYANLNKIQKNPNRYKFITIQSTMTDVIKSITGTDFKNIRHVHSFTSIKAKNTAIVRNIGFVGSNWMWGGENFIQEFLKKNPNDEEIKSAKLVLDEFIKYPFYDANYYYDKLHLNSKKRIDFFTLKETTARISGVKRAKCLEAIADLGLEIRGLYWDNSSMNYFPKALMCYNSNNIFTLDDNENFYNSSLIGFNTNHIQAVSGFSWRVCDILASNACLVSEFKPDIAKLFKKARIPMFTNEYEARSLVKRVLKEKNYRRDIIHRSHEIIDSEFRFDYVSSNIEDFLGISLNGNMQGSLNFLYEENKIINKKTNVVAKEDVRVNKFFANIISGFIFNKQKRDSVRDLLTKKNNNQLNNNQLMMKNYKDNDIKQINAKLDNLAKIVTESKDLMTKNYNLGYIDTFLPKYSSKVRRMLGNNELNQIVYYDNLYNSYQDIISNLRKRKIIRVGFLVALDSVFPAEQIFKNMINDDLFEPHIYVIPDVSRSKEFTIEQMKKTYDSLKKKYGDESVSTVYDENTASYVDISSEMDIYCTAIPYDGNNYNLYKSDYFSKNKVLSFFVNYGYPTVKWSRRVFTCPTLSRVMTLFTENPNLEEEYFLYQNAHGLNNMCVGYCKMDSLAHIKKVPHKRPRIILAPHHTITDKWKDSLQIGNFLKYSDFILKLPKMFPNVDFIFRPHPMLLETLKDDKIFGKEALDKYLQELASFTNITIQIGGDYFETFVNSDGIIHDCSSFVGEYLYTGNPCCYVLKNPEVIDKYFTEYGAKVLNAYYHAYDEDAIISFISNVVIKGNDHKKEERTKIFEKYIKFNYPNSSKIACDYLKSFLTNKQ